MANELVRFDWAMKRLLRQKSNFVILEGLISELLKEDIKIQQILESESNQQTTDDKFNRVDILAMNSANELVIIEVQNTKQYDYFHRMLYGTSKATAEHLGLGSPYSEIKKVYSINIVYFDLGQGEDYVYHGKASFVGIHQGDILGLSDKQQEMFGKKAVYQIFPEYYVVKVNNFNDLAKDTLDEWVYYLKNDAVLKNAKAKGLKQVAEFLTLQSLTPAEKRDYYRELENNRFTKSVLDTARIDGKRENAMETASKMKAKGFDNETIHELTGLPMHVIEKLENF